MTLVLLYLASFLLFLGLDYLGLTYLIKPIFERNIGDLLLDEFRLLPAFLFYAFYVAVLIWFVSWPALTAERSLWWVAGNAALFGAAAYGTYEFTNLAVLKAWRAEMVIADLSWGMLLSAAAACGGVWVVRSFT